MLVGGQEFTFALPEASPELMYGLSVYTRGTVAMERTLYVNNILLDLAGILSGVEHLVIGRGGTAILRYYPALTGHTLEAVT